MNKNNNKNIIIIYIWHSEEKKKERRKRTDREKCKENKMRESERRGESQVKHRILDWRLSYLVTPCEKFPFLPRTFSLAKSPKLN